MTLTKEQIEEAVRVTEGRIAHYKKLMKHCGPDEIDLLKDDIRVNEIQLQALQLAKDSMWQDIKKMPKDRSVLFQQKGTGYVFEGIHLVGMMNKNQAQQHLTGYPVDVVAWREKPQPQTETED